MTDLDDLDLMDAHVRLGDWRDVLPGTYDPSNTVVVTDPPFGLSSRGAPLNVGNTGRGYEDDTPWADHVSRVLAGLPASRYVIRGPATVLATEHPRARRYCTEVSTFRLGAYRPGVVQHMWQVWAVYGSLRVVNTAKAMPRDFCLIDARDDPHNVKSGTHRGTTPYRAALWAVETWVPPGWLVLDPFAGTGTIGRAALELGRRYLGAEVLAHWQREAVGSIRSTPLRLGLEAS